MEVLGGSINYLRYYHVTVKCTELERISGQTRLKHHFQSYATLNHQHVRNHQEDSLYFASVYATCAPLYSTVNLIIALPGRIRSSNRGLLNFAFSSPVSFISFLSFECSIPYPTEQSCLTSFGLKWLVT